MQPPCNPETDLRPDDRVLFIGIPDAAVLRAAAVRATAGIVVALDPDDDSVRAARREHRDRLNVMVVWASPHEIPWQNGHFTKVFDTRDGSWPQPERVATEIDRVRTRIA